MGLKPETQVLIERLEKAEGGSRELDLEIWGNHVAEPRSPRPWKLNVTPPAYTTSIDAIAALIREKVPAWRWSAYERRPLFEGVLGLNFQGRSDAGPHKVIACTAKTAPLALCIALLRALDHQGAQDG